MRSRDILPVLPALLLSLTAETRGAVPRRIGGEEIEGVVVLAKDDRASDHGRLESVEPQARSPEASLRSIRVRPGFEVELVASEPLVRDPIAFDWGADGKLWVVEMGDYPLGVDAKGKPGGVVKSLEDTDGDGRYDRSTVFLDGLGFPAGIMPWRRGVLIACAPEILFAEDRDGDGKADHREVLFNGFKPGNPQHRVNGFDFGLDGWVYGANGDSGGTIVSTKTGQAVGIGGRDFRFRPDDGRFEPENGQTQYGRHRDDWGNWFGDDNSTWAWHIVMSDQDLRRNTRTAIPDPRKVLDPDPRLQPISRTLPRFNDHDRANRVTSANSPTPYRDELFGPHFEGNLFVSEPVHNLVRRMVLDPDGVTFKGHRAADESDREFLASTDHWFRPTMLRTGPDGALWIADMYRAVIEHPEWIPDDWEAKLDLRAGHDRGRIYRVFPVDRRPRPIPRLDRLDIAGLVAALDSPNGWQRDTAQRLLLHSGDRSAVELLRRLAETSPRPEARLQALWTLECLDATTPESVRKALSDAHPEVRRHAIRVGQGLIESHPDLGEAMLRLADDPEIRVRFQLALSLGAWDDPKAGHALAALLRRDPDDPWLRAAVLSAATPHAATILAALFAGSGAEPPPAQVVEPLFALAAAHKGARGLAPLVRSVTTPAAEDGRYAPWQFSALVGLVEAADRARAPLERWGDDDPDVRLALGRLDDVFEAARGLVRDEGAPVEARLIALRVLGRRPADRRVLASLLEPRVAGPLQHAAISALGRSRDRDVPETLLSAWRAYAPALRDAILDALLGRDDWTAALLSALEARRIPVAEVGPVHRRRLLEHRDLALRERASALFAANEGGRQQVIDRAREALRMPGDPRAGAAVFKRHCASCHRLEGEGTEVGPDLAALTDRSPEALLVAILDPNRTFESKYTNYTVYTTGGRTLTGMIAAETATGVTLRRQEGRDEVLLRADIEELASSGQSLMPEGMEKDITTRDLADLIAYLAASRAEPRR